jgi:hypothetical protein
VDATFETHMTLHFSAHSACHAGDLTHGRVMGIWMSRELISKFKNLNVHS